MNTKERFLCCQLIRLICLNNFTIIRFKLSENRLTNARIREAFGVVRSEFNNQRLFLEPSDAAIRVNGFVTDFMDDQAINDWLDNFKAWVNKSTRLIEAAYDQHDGPDSDRIPKGMFYRLCSICTTLSEFDVTIWTDALQEIVFKEILDSILCAVIEDLDGLRFPPYGLMNIMSSYLQTSSSLLEERADRGGIYREMTETINAAAMNFPAPEEKASRAAFTRAGEFLKIFLIEENV